jgi:hypothetical protein
MLSIISSGNRGCCSSTVSIREPPLLETEQCVLKLWRRICLQLNELRIEVVRRKSHNKFVSFLVRLICIKNILEVNAVLHVKETNDFGWEGHGM